MVVCLKGLFIYLFIFHYIYFQETVLTDFEDQRAVKIQLKCRIVLN